MNLYQFKIDKLNQLEHKSTKLQKELEEKDKKISRMLTENEEMNMMKDSEINNLQNELIEEKLNFTKSISMSSVSSSTGPGVGLANYMNASTVPKIASGVSKSGGGELIKTGCLQKEGHLVHNWKNRYFFLMYNTLIYYEKAHCVNERGRLSLKDYNVLHNNGEKEFSLCSHSVTPSGHALYRLVASSSKQAEEWVQALVASGCRLEANS